MQEQNIVAKEKNEKKKQNQTKQNQTEQKNPRGS